MRTLYRCTECGKVFGADRSGAIYRLDCPLCGNVMETPVSLEEQVALEKKEEGGAELLLHQFPSQASSHRRFVRSVVAIIIIGALGLVALYFFMMMVNSMAGMVK